MDDTLLPPWVDAEFSKSLPALCAKGEGQGLEFKLQLPTQAHDIAKSLAAFASSNDGLLVYGVGDDGHIVGLTKAGDSKWRDLIHQRLLGAAKAVKPPVQITVSWASIDGLTACVVAVKKGSAAVYYANHRPIVRTGSISRPAEPSEVEQIFRLRYSSQNGLSLMPSNKQIGRRMRRVLDLLNEGRQEGLTLVDLASAMELPLAAQLEAIVEGIDSPTFAVLDHFSARFAVNKEWLATGRGEPFRSALEILPLPEHYLASIEAASPRCIYLARSTSDVGESFIVVQADDLQAWTLPDVWHVSDHVGGGGSRALLSLYDLFRRWSSGSNRYSVLGRLIDSRLANSVISGKTHPGVVANLPLSHWWDDLTDLDHKWTSRQGVIRAYGGGFAAAQDIVRAMLSKSRS